MSEFADAIEHDRRQLALMAVSLPAQFLPGVPETPEERYVRKLEECGAGSNALKKSWEDLCQREPWVRSLT